MTDAGKFITLEGGEGAGKSTQAKALAAYLQARGIEVVLTREVGGAPSAEAIRKLWLEPGQGYWDALTELLLITAARREHLVKTIWPALERGAWVISDRFADSTHVYQGVGLELGTGIVDHFYDQIAEDFEPHLTLLLDLPVEVGMQRVVARAGQDDRYQQQKLDFHQKLRSAYLALATDNPNRFRVVDASQDSAAVTAAITAVASGFFGIS